MLLPVVAAFCLFFTHCPLGGAHIMGAPLRWGSCGGMRSTFPASGRCQVAVSPEG